MNPDQPTFPLNSTKEERDALKRFAEEQRAYQEARAAGGVDLSEPRPEDQTLGSQGIQNRADARRAGIHTRRMHGRQMAVPVSKQKAKKRRKAAKLARRRNRAS